VAVLRRADTQPLLDRRIEVADRDAAHRYRGFTFLYDIIIIYDCVEINDCERPDCRRLSLFRQTTLMKGNHRTIKEWSAHVWRRVLRTVVLVPEYELLLGV
jgi:hypothetical protein